MKLCTEPSEKFQHCKEGKLEIVCVLVENIEILPIIHPQRVIQEGVLRIYSPHPPPDSNPGGSVKDILPSSTPR